MDLLTNEGFANAMYFACNLAPGSGHVSAPVCSTWVFMQHSKMINVSFWGSLPFFEVWVPKGRFVPFDTPIDTSKD